jgi:nitronate monooxygenase
MTHVSSPELALAACRNGVIGSFPSHTASTIDQLSGWLTAIADELKQHTDATGSPRRRWR